MEKSIKKLSSLLSKLLVPVVVWIVLCVPVIICLQIIAWLISYDGVLLGLLSAGWGVIVTLAMHKCGII